ncbi:hypothetical protein [Sorangium sp. So ce388]|uniref:hypothetical protein n=1 Tax=Sorangium sp. So ce388 TaxID=3133309 RepID=UPI003F5B76E4
MSVYDEIAAERAVQDAKWGGRDADDRNTPNDWIAYIAGHAGRAWSSPLDLATYRKQLIRVAALAVAAVESLDRHLAKRLGDGG